MRVVIWKAVSRPEQAETDKISLSEQERAGREWAAQHGGEVVAVLTIPGESRSDSDVITIFEEFAAKEIFAYHDLRKMWQEPRQFDVLFCYHDSRLGRSESLFAYVVTNVMRSGAKIYSHLGGWYVPDNYQLKMAIGMINVSSEMQRLQSVGWAAKQAKAPEGELVHGPPPWGYLVTRNEKGRTIRMVPDESKRVIIEAAARLLIDGVSWFYLEQELFARYGYTRDNGKPFYRWFFYSLFYNPVFWGHAAIGRLARYKTTKRTKHTRNGQWAFDRACAPPDGVQIWYDVNTPYLIDDPSLGENNLGGRLRDELIRRRDVVRGRSRTTSLQMFSGLLICYECGYAFTFGRVSKKRIPIYRCRSKWTAGTNCRVGHIQEKQVRAWFDEQLRAMIAANDPQLFQRMSGSEQDSRREENLRAAAARLDQQLERGIDEQLSTENPQLRESFRRRLEKLSADRLAIERELEQLTRQNTAQRLGSQDAYRVLLSFPLLDDFWSADTNLINRTLYGLLGDNVLVVKEKRISGAAKRKRPKVWKSQD